MSSGISHFRSVPGKSPGDTAETISCWSRLQVNLGELSAVSLRAKTNNGGNLLFRRLQGVILFLSMRVIFQAVFIYMP